MSVMSICFNEEEFKFKEEEFKEEEFKEKEFKEKEFKEEEFKEEEFKEEEFKEKEFKFEEVDVNDPNESRKKRTVSQVLKLKEQMHTCVRFMEKNADPDGTIDTHYYEYSKLEYEYCAKKCALLVRRHLMEEEDFEEDEENIRVWYREENRKIGDIAPRIQNTKEYLNKH
jgi:hypothetical protein